jgi:hypothetical protein
MSLIAKIYDQEESPDGRSLSDEPDHFLSLAVAHARKSSWRFPLLSAVDPSIVTQIDADQRERLKKEWLMLESLAIGPQERAKWQALFKALTRGETFQGLQFVEH